MKLVTSSLRKTTLLFLLAPAIAAAAPSTPQEQAEFLAGIDLPGSSVLAELQKSPAYKSHQKELQDKWAFCKQARYSAMQSWSDANLRNAQSSRDVLRYLFGGPDFLNAFAFFPEVGTMVLGGLEPVGEVPPPESLKPGSYANSLAALRQALRTSLYCGYFITSEMGGQLHQGAFRGVLPVLYTELALTGNRIQSVEMVKPFGSPGVKITYVRQGHITPQTLYYFQANLANGAECQRFLTWLGEQGSGPAYLKAASYLLHGSEFSQTRNFLLNTSTLVVEDDSGIPFKYFDPGTWKVRVFGEYASPLPIFSGYAQRDFKAAYSTPANAGPIKFGAGYHVIPSHANILLATRISPVAAVAKALATPPPKPVATPVSSPTPAAAPIQTVQIAKAAPTPISHEAYQSQSLTALENEELKIRADQSISREEKMKKLHEVWTLQLIAMGKAPKSADQSVPKASSKKSPGSVVKPKATPKSLSEALESPTPKATPTPEPTATPVPAPAPSTPESQSTPVPAQGGNNINTNAETAPSPSNTPTASPEQKAPEAAPASTPSETPQPAAAEMPKASPQASSEPAAPAPSATGTTN